MSLYFLKYGALSNKCVACDQFIKDPEFERRRNVEREHDHEDALDVPKPSAFDDGVIHFVVERFILPNDREVDYSEKQRLNGLGACLEDDLIVSIMPNDSNNSNVTKQTVEGKSTPITSNSAAAAKNKNKFYSYHLAHNRCLQKALAMIRQHEKKEKTTYCITDMKRRLRGFDASCAVHCGMLEHLACSPFACEAGFFPVGCSSPDSFSFSLQYKNESFSKVQVPLYLYAGISLKPALPFNMFTQCIRVVPFVLTVYLDGNETFYTALNSATIIKMLTTHFAKRPVYVNNSKSVSSMYLHMDVNVNENVNMKNKNNATKKSIEYDISLICGIISASEEVNAMKKRYMDEKVFLWHDLLDSNKDIWKMRHQNEVELNFICDKIVASIGNCEFNSLREACGWYMHLKNLVKTTNTECKSRFTVHVEVDKIFQSTTVAFNCAQNTFLTPVFVNMQVLLTYLQATQQYKEIADLMTGRTEKNNSNDEHTDMQHNRTAVTLIRRDMNQIASSNTETIHSEHINANEKALKQIYDMFNTSQYLLPSGSETKRNLKFTCNLI